MSRSRLSRFEAATARRYARQGASLVRISTVLRRPYAEVFAAVRGVDYPHDVLGQRPVSRLEQDSEV